MLLRFITVNHTIRINSAVDTNHEGVKTLKSIAEYEFVYENWYCKSCEKINETPVSFATYLRIVPVKEMKQLKSFLAEGRMP